MGDVVPIEKFNGKTKAEIDALAKEYIGLHQINDSAVHEERFNLPAKRNDEVGKVRDGLEGVVSSILGDRVYPDKEGADRIVEGLVAKGYEAEGQKLPGDSTERAQKIQEYVGQAGVDYTQLLKQIISTRKPTKMSDLPEDHPLRRLITYVTAKSHKGQNRVQFIPQRLASLGAVHRESVIEALNKYGELRLDPRYATIDEALQTFGQRLQAKMAQYDANEPSKVHNQAYTNKKAA
ncbi:hypothetical protein CMO83_04545 [Candidatus Woesearchaeota archaeon]|jgi:hypothetical protein|nr:hypothetical protein [Candidatus Woesearchaeota archaeon]MDP6648421.1 hypothetical protein [Candidatus Woesearchaeota archaeon]|tara:strand:+ start:37883 stop:38590 length:708 start_codon:yes stop_codon:yes gene_type:complete